MMPPGRARVLSGTRRQVIVPALVVVPRQDIATVTFAANALGTMQAPYRGLKLAASDAADSQMRCVGAGGGSPDHA